MLELKGIESATDRIRKIRDSLYGLQKNFLTMASKSAIDCSYKYLRTDASNLRGFRAILHSFAFPESSATQTPESTKQVS